MKYHKTLMLALLAALMIFRAPASSAEALCSMNDGKPADGKSVLELHGKKHEFCCAGCLQKFKDAPEHFAQEPKTRAPASASSAEAACSSVCSE